MKLPGTGAIPFIQPAQIGEAHPVHAGAPRVIPRVRSQQCDPRNDSGIEIPGWSDTLHNTPALVRVNDGHRIVKVAMEMNPSGKRKYVGSEILNSLRPGERIVYAPGNRGIT